MVRATGDVDKTAVISPCGRYRYVLTRTWDYTLPVLVFCMLNPSTADASEDDPTIRRCMGFARRENCGGIAVVNIFAWRATDPSELPDDMAMAAGPDNSRHLDEVLKDRRVVAAWGANATASRMITSTFLGGLRTAATSVHCLGRTKSGAPRHPLYVRGDALLEDL
ncbi:hypothetical protein BJI69_14145 [Luteibacter rhizovicinus DSM 16549]|uniref:Uncharacterized protein n=2 Tax=Luteibacter rhizovicinus TaxID=242606 RepID=A0A0G9HFH3_9GAMM|nr:hypothetical protein BJI69_14145 [Luteibacter rhizovicinus DSM 16549]KLD68478.1 hypothetical protein Y883_02020 [Luteibacter rhizovicinus DSM 16549]KLD76737.1 hypothetical protein Y886_19770 [Xanthomonas hyacinthi DSM 19077]